MTRYMNTPANTTSVKKCPPPAMRSTPTALPKASARAVGEEPPLRRRERGRRHGPERARRFAGNERAIVRAIAARIPPRGEAIGTAELGDVDRPRPAPMILQQRIGEEAGADRERPDQEQHGLGFDQHAPARKQKLAEERDACRHDQERDQRACRSARVLRPHMGVERKIVCLRVVERRGHGKVEPRPDAEDDAHRDADRSAR